MRRTLTAPLAVLFALMMISTPVAGAVATGASDRVSPLADSAVTWNGYNLPDEQVYHSVSGEPQPGVFVSVESSGDLSALEQWANSSADRRVVDRYDASNTYLIAAPMSDIQRPITSLARYNPGGERTVSELGYVTGWDLNIRVQYADPINNLATEDEHERPAGARAAELIKGGDFSASSMAWSDDVNETHVANSRKYVGADGLSQTGAGVNIAVIDSGVNFGNGTLYGDGTKGSDMRVADAYDYVDGEEPDLSVSRSELPNELDKMADPNGHGSWVSSATLNAQNGIAPDATLHAYRTLNSEGSGSTSDIRAAIARADRTGADILIMSLGSPLHSEAMADELRRALSEDGNVTAAFIAVGNSYPMRVSSPADVDKVIGVQAASAGNATTAKKAYFGNGGPDNGLDNSGGTTRGITPDTAAPGMKVTTPVFARADSLSTTNKTLSGTSMAAPLAGGAGALVLEAKPGLEGNATGFHDVIVNSGTHTTQIGVTESEGGMVNASRAINGYNGTDAPDRILPADTRSRDAGNRFLAGGAGLKLATISEVSSRVAG